MLTADKVDPVSGCDSPGSRKTLGGMAMIPSFARDSTECGCVRKYPLPGSTTPLAKLFSFSAWSSVSLARVQYRSVISGYVGSSFRACQACRRSSTSFGSCWKRMRHASTMDFAAITPPNIPGRSQPLDKDPSQATGSPQVLRHRAVRVGRQSSGNTLAQGLALGGVQVNAVDQVVSGALPHGKSLVVVEGYYPMDWGVLAFFRIIVQRPFVLGFCLSGRVA